MAEKMKPSGIDWIGDVPENWYMIKLKYFSYLKGRIGWQGLTADEFIDEGPYLITGTDFENGRIQFDRSYHISDERYNEAPEIQLKEGDLLVTKDGTVGKMAYVDMLPDKASLNSHLLLIRPLENKFDNRFLFWLMSSSVFNGYTEYAQDGTVMASLSQEKIGNFIAYFPEITEQQAIADFLDKECAKIDSIAADLEKQIALLQQYKKSLITETVTKGLDKSVPMKDSGIEGVGKIPSHWKVNRLKYAAVVKTGPFGTQLSASEYSDEGIPVINVKNIGYGTIIEDDLDYVPDEVCQRLAQHQLQFGDIVFGRKGAVDKHAIITESQIGWVQGSDCIRVRIYKDIESRYLNYLFDTVYFAEYVLLYAVGTTMASINSDILTNSKILVPPITEQRCIADFLDSNCKVLSEIIENKQSQLATLQQHKKSLIYEYVTGKKRVKEVQ